MSAIGQSGADSWSGSKITAASDEETNFLSRRRSARNIKKIFSINNGCYPHLQGKHSKQEAVEDAAGRARGDRATQQNNIAYVHYVRCTSAWDKKKSLSALPNVALTIKSRFQNQSGRKL